jgi:hypothetical protein
MVLNATGDDSLTEVLFTNALTGKLGGADAADAGTIKSFAVEYFAGRRLHERGRYDRQFPVVHSPGSATVSFEVPGSISALGFCTAAAFQTSLEDSLDAAVQDRSLTTALQLSCNCTDI